MKHNGSEDATVFRLNTEALCARKPKTNTYAAEVGVTGCAGALLFSWEGRAMAKRKIMPKEEATLVACLKM